MRISHGPRALVGAILSLIAETTLAIPSARSESVEEFYRGKTLQINVGFGAGGSYDTYARVLVGAHRTPNPRQSADDRPEHGRCRKSTARKLAVQRGP